MPSPADYGRINPHRRMLKDHVRCETYRKAILKFVKPNDVVLDVGMGTGILSIFAAQAGARKIYAVENTSIAEFGKQVIKMNGAENKIEIIREDIESAVLPEKVDVIVAEWMGYFGIDENLLAPVLLARDRWLKAGGKMLPERVSAWMAPIEDSEIEKELEFWRTHPYGVDLSLMVYGERYLGLNDINSNNFLSDPQMLWSHDTYTYSADDARLDFKALLSFSAKRKGNLSALAAWFSAEFCDDIILTNAPDAPGTHWKIVKFNTSRPIIVYPGMDIDFELTCKPVGPLYTHCKWSVRTGDSQWEHHDEEKIKSSCH